MPPGSYFEIQFEEQPSLVAMLKVQYQIVSIY